MQYWWRLHQKANSWQFNSLFFYCVTSRLNYNRLYFIFELLSFNRNPTTNENRNQLRSMITLPNYKQNGTLKNCLYKISQTKSYRCKLKKEKQLSFLFTEVDSNWKLRKSDAIQRMSLDEYTEISTSSLDQIKRRNGWISTSFVW